MRLVPDGKKVTLDELLPGTLFAFGDDCIAIKSEYRCANGLIEAFIVGSGEQFWGGAKTAKEQNALMVQPLAIEEVVRCKDCKWGTTPYGDERDGWTECNNLPGKPLMRDEGFCSCGERRAHD